MDIVVEDFDYERILVKWVDLIKCILILKIFYKCLNYLELFIKILD